MTTLIVRLSPTLARRLAATADYLELDHEETARLALRLMTREVGRQQKAAQKDLTPCRKKRRTAA